MPEAALTWSRMAKRRELVPVQHLPFKTRQTMIEEGSWSHESMTHKLLDLESARVTPFRLLFDPLQSYEVRGTSK